MGMANVLFGFFMNLHSFSRQTKVFTKCFLLIWRIVVSNKGIRLTTRPLHAA